jgi:hypothetical protein
VQFSLSLFPNGKWFPKRKKFARKHLGIQTIISRCFLVYYFLHYTIFVFLLILPSGSSRSLLSCFLYYLRVGADDPAIPEALERKSHVPSLSRNSGKCAEKDFFRIPGTLKRI